MEGDVYFHGGFNAESNGEAGTIHMTRARIGGVLDCTGATLRNQAGPALYADGMFVRSGVLLNTHFYAEATAWTGAIRLPGSQVGWLDCSGAVINNGSGPALSAERVEVAGNVSLGDFTATSAGQYGGVSLAGARISGQFTCPRASIQDRTGPAILADGAKIDGGVMLNDDFNAVGAGELGTIRLNHARIAGQLACSATLRNLTGPVLSAEGLQVDGNAVLTGLGEGAGTHGTLNLDGARISGLLKCSYRRLHNARGSALSAHGIQTEAAVHLGGHFTAQGELGAVYLYGARIGGELDCTGARFRNTAGPALAADGMQVDGDVYLHNKFDAKGNGEGGAVHIPRARIDGMLGCSRSSLRNESGPALHADGIRVGSGVFLNTKFNAECSGRDHAIRLLGAQIGRLDCTGGRIHNKLGAAFCADGMQVAGDVFFNNCIADGNSQLRTIRLTDVRIGGSLISYSSQVTTDGKGAGACWDVDGLTYSRVPLLDDNGNHREAWLHLIRTATSSYAAQPYQQLAAGYRAEGRDYDVRTILIAQRWDQRKRGALTRRRDKVWNWVIWLLLGYGYQTWRALLALVVLLGISLVATFLLGTEGLDRAPSASTATVATTDIQGQPVARANGGSPRVPCTHRDTALKAIDLGVPFLPTTGEGCQATDTAAGTGLSWMWSVLHVLAWGLAALFIAGFTRIVRK
jgi:hypothetical protein